MMRLIITGASGFLGKNMLLGAPRNWEIVALYNNANIEGFLRDRGLNNVKTERCDLANPQEVAALAERIGPEFDACLYLAANTVVPLSVENPIFDLQTNTISVINFLENFRGNRFIYLSSGAVYDSLSGQVDPGKKVSPLIPYAISKLASENYVRFYVMKKKTFGSYVIIRFFGAYGPYEPERKIYTRLVKRFCLERKRSFTVYGDGRNLIDAMYVDDAVKGILKVIESEASNLTLDFCSENPITINELVYEAARIFGVGMPKLLHEGHTEEYILFHVSGRKMEESFDFRPKVKLNEGLRELAEWLQNRC